MSKELSKIGTNALALPSYDALQELGSDGISIRILPRIKIPSGGGLAFEIPSSDEGGQTSKVIEGFILDVLPTRAFWPTRFEGGNEPPMCFSTDGRVGQGDPGGKCDSCEFNQWGSIRKIDPSRPEGDRGKACNERRLVLFLLPGKAIPAAISLPPTSIKEWETYKTALLFDNIPYWKTTTKIKLTQDKSQSGITYSKASLSRGSVVESPQEIHELTKYRETVLSVIKESHAKGVINVQDYAVEPTV